MAEPPFAVGLVQKVLARFAEFAEFADEGEHDRQRPAGRGAQQRLQLHPQDARFLEPHADGAPAHRGVRLLDPLHVGQHLVRPDVERAENDAAPFRRVEHARIERGKLAALGHMAADQELKLGAEQADAVGPRSLQRRKVGHEARVHVQRDRRAAGRRCRQVAQAGVAGLRLGLHGDLVAEGVGDRVFGAQVDDALIAVDKDAVAVQRLGGDAFGVDDKRNGQRARDDGGMAADRAFLEHHALEAAAVVEQLARADVARDEDRVGGQLRAGVAALPGQDAQKPVRQIVKIVQAVAQIGVGHRFQPGAGQRLFLFHRRLGRQAAGDVFLHPPHPAAGIGEHAVGFQHLPVFAVGRFGAGDHRIDREAQFVRRSLEALEFLSRIVAHRIGDDDARLVQPDVPLGRAFLPGRAAEHHRLLVERRKCLALADEGAKLGHLGQHHRHDFQRVDLVVGILAGLLALHDKDAELFAQPLDRDAEERGIDFLARLRHVAEAALGRCVGGVDGVRGLGDAAHQPLAQLHPRLVDGFLLQPLGRAKFQRVVIAEQVDRADFRADAVGNQVGDAVKTFLPGAGLGQGIAQAPEQLAAFTFRAVGHDPPFQDAFSSWKASWSA